MTLCKSIALTNWKSKTILKELYRGLEQSRKNGEVRSSRRCSVKTVFLEISQNSQENTCARVSFLITPGDSFCEVKQQTSQNCHFLAENI